MTTKLAEGDTVVLTRAVDMPFGIMPYRSMLIVSAVIECPAEGLKGYNLERADGSLAISGASPDTVREA